MLQCWGRGVIGKVWRNNLGMMGPGAGAMFLGLFPPCSAASSFLTIWGSLTEFTTEWIFDGERLFFSEEDGDEQTFCSLLFLGCSSVVASTALTFQSQRSPACRCFCLGRNKGRERVLLFIVFVLFAGGWLKNKCLWVVIAQSLGHFRVLFYISTGLQHSRRIPRVCPLSHRYAPSLFTSKQELKILEEEKELTLFTKRLPVFYQQFW